MEYPECFHNVSKGKICIRMAPMADRNPSFLQHLFDKRATVERIGEETGKNVHAALEEINRQIRQAMEGGDPVKGKGVTKSGGDDGF